MHRPAVTDRILATPLLAGLLVAATCATAGLAAARLTAGCDGASRPDPRQLVRVDCQTPERCAAVEALALDVWTDVRAADQPLDIVVTRAELPALLELGLGWETLVDDIDADAAAERARIRGARATDGGDDWFAEYRDNDAITSHLGALVERSPGLVSSRLIGRSIEGRPIFAYRIGPASATGKPLLVSGTLHAREWIAAMATTCVADRLARDYETSAGVRALLDQTPIWIAPMMNPDGYEHTWGANRYWRKNRRGTHGVDLNRNFSIAWGGAGSSNRERAETYRGATAFSEPESRALRDLAISEGIGAYLDFHSYGQLLLYPWSYTAKPAADHARLAAVGDRLATALYAPHQQRYELKTGADLYAASGTAFDFMYGETGALAYTVELRPAGRKGLNGFVLPPAQIKPTCDEAYAAVLALGEAQ